MTGGKRVHVRRPRGTGVSRWIVLGLAGAMAVALLSAPSAANTSAATADTRASHLAQASRAHGAEARVSHARRVISLVPSLTESLFAMGAGAQVVAVSSYDEQPAEVRTLPRVGALLDPDVERMLSLRPDLVVGYASQTELRTQLARAGIAMVDYRHGGLRDTLEAMRDLGARVGHAEGAARLVAGLEADLAEVVRRLAGRRRPRTLLVFGRERGALRGVWASGGAGFLHDMLEAAGGENVLADVPTESLQVSIEQVLARRPEVILELHPTDGETPDGLARERAVWQTLAGVPAVRNGRVYLLAGRTLVIPGPGLAAATRRFAEVLHPEALAR